MSDKFNVPCPECKTVRQRTFEELKASKSFVCKKCGITVVPDGKKLIKDLNTTIGDAAKVMERLLKHK